MHYDLWNHPRKEVFEQADGESEVCPVMPVFHDFQRIALEVDSSFKIHLVKRLHGDLVLPTILDPVILTSKVEVMLGRPTRISRFLILPGRNCRRDTPKGHENGHRGEYSDEDPCE